MGYNWVMKKENNRDNYPTLFKSSKFLIYLLAVSILFQIHSEESNAQDDIITPNSVDIVQASEFQEVFEQFFTLSSSFIESFETSQEAEADSIDLKTGNSEIVPEQEINLTSLETESVEPIEEPRIEFSDLLTESGELPTRFIMLPDGSGFNQDENIQLLRGNEIAQVVYNQSRIAETAELFKLDNLLEEDSEQVIAHGEWVDSYLDIIRMGSKGTTLMILDEDGNFLKFIPAVHTDLLFGDNPTVLSNTYLEEAYQNIIYTQFVNMWSSNKEYFSKWGIETNQDVLELLTDGNLRAFLEYVQHAALHENDSGWVYFPYKIQVGPSPLSDQVLVVNEQVTDILSGLEDDEGESIDYLFLLNSFSNFEEFTKLNDNFIEENGYPIWESFGMFREGMRIVPSSEQTNLSLSYVTADTKIPEIESTYDFSEHIGEDVYVTAINQSEVFTVQGDRELIPSENRVVSPGRILRINIIDKDTAQVLPDNEVYMPYGNGSQEIYIRLENFSPIIDFSPINVFESTESQDKQIVVLQNESPQIILLEGGKVVLRAPVVLGSYNNTPSGEHRISQTRASRHMPGQPGVGYTNYFGSGYALHDSPWWNWESIQEGYYGSHGCINLPSSGWQSIDLANGDSVTVSAFVYRWISTVTDYPEATEEKAFVSWDTPGFYDGTGAVRLIVISNVEDLAKYSDQGSASMEELITEINNHPGFWLPEFNSGTN